MPRGYCCQGVRHITLRTQEWVRGYLIKKHLVIVLLSACCHTSGISSVPCGQPKAFLPQLHCASPDSDPHYQWAHGYQGLLYKAKSQFRNILWLLILGHPQKSLVQHSRKGNESCSLLGKANQFSLKAEQWTCPVCVGFTSTSCCHFQVSARLKGKQKQAIFCSKNIRFQRQVVENIKFWKETFSNAVSDIHNVTTGDQ